MSIGSRLYGLRFATSTSLLRRKVWREIQRHAKWATQRLKRFDCWVSLTSLDTRDVALPDSAQVRELTLGETGGKSSFEEFGANAELAPARIQVATFRRRRITFDFFYEVAELIGHVDSLARSGVMRFIPSP
ncbi:hypothetical protein BDZ31_003051 [Conexibacter arvalis]|uniref:Uncharacterized protein n=1 Tax=Conexibacter arvalis TaxID=912552 RepID=A0A840IF67_9ACTN|nr:hypothetical protein [Conexibacter arvalis]